MLHNRCIDWGLRKLRRGQNRDPEHEMNIQVRAHMRFTRYNREITAEEVPPERERYVFKNYGGPVPRGGVHGRQRGVGDRAHGRGRGRGAPADEHVGGPIRAGHVLRRGRGRGRGCGRAGGPNGVH